MSCVPGAEARAIVRMSVVAHASRRIVTTSSSTAMPR